MPPSRRRASPAPVPPSNLVRQQRWAGLTPGQAVDVAGERRGATWVFVAHVRNARTGDEWVEVVGGRSGDRNVRSFPPERIFPAGGLGPVRRPSLAEAPQLPLR